MGTMTIYIEWRLTANTKFRFEELIDQYEQCFDGSEAQSAITEEIKRLPGYPIAAPPETDFLLVVTDRMN
jgi:hypothetical protein